MKRPLFLYEMETPECTVILAARNRPLLDITPGDKSQIAIEGNRAYVIDNSGNEVQMPIIHKEVKL